MARLKITPKDMKMGKIVKPDWHVLEIADIQEKANKAGDANNLEVEFVGVSAGVEQVPFKIWISEKAPGILGPNFLRALGVEVSEDEGVNVELTNDTCKGKKVKALIKTGEYNGRPNNQIVDFAPVA